MFKEAVTLTDFLLLMQIVAIIGSVIAFYWKLRELVFRLHNENQRLISDLQVVVRLIERDVKPLVEWWNHRQERRDR